MGSYVLFKMVCIVNFDVERPVQLISLFQCDVNSNTHDLVYAVLFNRNNI